MSKVGSPLVSEFQGILKEVRRYGQHEKEKEFLTMAINKLSASTSPKETILRSQQVFVEPLVDLLHINSQLDNSILQVLHMLTIQEMISLTMYEMVYNKLLSVISTENINTKIIQIISTTLTTPLLPSLPGNVIYLGMATITFAATTPLLLSTVISVITHIASATSLLLPQHPPKLSQNVVHHTDAVRMTDFNKNYLDEILTEPTNPLVVALSKYINEISISPQFSSVRVHVYEILEPILQSCGNVFYQVKSFYQIILQIVIPKIPQIAETTLNYHITLMKLYSTFPGYPFYITQLLKNVNEYTVALFLQFFTNNPAFVLHPHFTPIVLCFLQNAAKIGQPVSLENITTPRNIGEMSFFCFYLLVSAFLTSNLQIDKKTVESAVEILLGFENTPNTLDCYKKMLRVMAKSGIDMSSVIDNYEKIPGGWDGIVKSVIDLGESFRGEWKTIWKLVSKDHYKSVSSISVEFGDKTLLSLVQNLIPYVTTFEYYSELLLILKLNFLRMSAIFEVSKTTLVKGVLEGGKISNEILSVFAEVISLTNGIEDTQAEEYNVRTTLSFVLTILRERKGLVNLYAPLMATVSPLTEYTGPLSQYMDVLVPIFEFFAESNSSVVGKSFNILRQIAVQLPINTFPLELIKRYTKQEYDINVSLSAIQLLSDLLLLIKEAKEDVKYSVAIFRQLFLCLKDERFDIWNCSLQTLVQALACEEERLSLCVVPLLETVIFPTFDEMDKIFEKIVKVKIPEERSKVLLYTPAETRQWNESVCVLLGGLTRILKFLLPFVVDKLPIVFGKFIKVTDLGFYRASMNTCEVGLKYVFSLLKYAEVDNDIYYKVLQCYLEVGKYIADNNGINTTICTYFLSTTQTIMKEEISYIIVGSLIKYVCVFPDDFVVDENGMCSCQNSVFGIIEMTESYKNSETNYIKWFCKMMELMVKYFEECHSERAFVCLNICLCECIQRIDNNLKIQSVLDKGSELIEDIANSLQSARGVLIQLSKIMTEKYKSTMGNVLSLITQLGGVTTKGWSRLVKTVYQVEDLAKLNEVYYQIYPESVTKILKVIEKTGENDENIQVVRHIISLIHFEGYEDDLIEFLIKSVLEVIQSESEISKYTQTIFVQKLTEDLHCLQSVIDSENTPKYKIHQTTVFLATLQTLVTLNLLQINKMAIYKTAVSFFSLGNVSVRSYALNLLVELENKEAKEYEIHLENMSTMDFGSILTEPFDNRLEAYFNPEEKVTASLQTPQGTLLGTSLGRVFLFSPKTNDFKADKQLFSKEPIIGLGYDSNTFYAAHESRQVVRIFNDFKSIQVEEEAKSSERLVAFAVDLNGTRNKKTFSYGVMSGNNAPTVRIVDKSGYGIFGATTNLVCKNCNRLSKIMWVGNVICAVAGVLVGDKYKEAKIFLYDFNAKTKDFQDPICFKDVEIEKDAICCVVPCQDNKFVISWGKIRINVGVSPSFNTEMRKTFDTSPASFPDEDLKIEGMALMENRLIAFARNTSGLFGLKILQSSSVNEVNGFCDLGRTGECQGMYSFKTDVERIVVVRPRKMDIGRMRKESDTIKMMLEKKMYRDVLYKIVASKEKFSDKGDIQDYWRMYVLDLKNITDDSLVCLETHLRENVIDQSDVVAIIQETEKKSDMEKMLMFFTQYCVKYYHKLKRGYNTLLVSKSCMNPKETSCVITEDFYKAFRIKSDLESHPVGSVVNANEYQNILRNEIDKYNEVLLFPGLPASIQNEIGKMTTSSKELVSDTNISDFQGFVIQFNINNGLYSAACQYALKTQNPETLLFVLKIIEKQASDRLKDIVSIFNDYDSVRMCMPQQDTLKSLVLEFHIYQQLFMLFEKAMTQAMRNSIFESLAHQIDEKKNGPQMLYASVSGRIADVGSYGVQFLKDVVKKYKEENDGRVDEFERNSDAVKIVQDVVDVVDKRNSVELARKVFSDVIGYPVLIPIMLKRSQFKVQLFDEVPDTFKMGDVSESVRDTLCSLKFSNHTLKEVLGLATSESKNKLSKAREMRGVTFNTMTVCAKCKKPATGSVKMFYCGHIYHESCHKGNACMLCSTM
ncbi:hypothetical protein EIN_086120 [Entamoeba invadens IP1]|uniref:hypothetical protein n=1 Tax=Entamoeba invadens IP1 TaxID=370355 RepID=UPI0002C3F014|nr:hypothetical protein EIN_086120 [Entamoeba invadens IP1]ELP85360.1 hypothetical protein EIN_086120 [Entamoeba invadens IP1]|eukprot:XP_004184706.1 hypothetical protein EIN_086120 [Entamoeba invadens IP1]